jgi:hypothetical protein
MNDNVNSEQANSVLYMQRHVGEHSPLSLFFRSRRGNYVLIHLAVDTARVHNFQKNFFFVLSVILFPASTTLGFFRRVLFLCAKK